MQYHAASYAEDVWDVYWFEKNLFGDVVALYDEAGTKLITYTYDAHGRCWRMQHNGGYSTTAMNNPFRYRGYYYDSDLELYVLNSRYYDAYTGRFISPDSVYYLNPVAINGLNLYSYCFNNSINYVDSNGCYPVKIQVGKSTIYFHPPHGNGPNAQHHIHIKNGNVKIASRNYDGSVHDKKYGKNYVPSKEIYNALLSHGWNWYGNKISLFDFNGFYKEEFPLQQQGYSLEQFPITTNGLLIEFLPNQNNGIVLESIPQASLNVPHYNPFPLTNNEIQILVVAVVSVTVIAIVLIPVTGGASAILLIA